MRVSIDKIPGTVTVGIVDGARNAEPPSELRAHKHDRIAPVSVAQLAERMNLKHVDRPRYQTVDGDGRTCATECLDHPLPRDAVRIRWRVA
jgi:hypothetical protein